MQTLYVRDLMTADPHTMQPDDDVAELWDLMDSMHFRHVPIVDKAGDLVGLVSNRDLLRSTLSDKNELPVSLQYDLLRTVKVNEVMTTAIETVDPDTPLDEAADIMLENKFGCLPVVEGTELVGILTESDFVRFVTEGLKHRSDKRAASRSL